MMSGDQSDLMEALIAYCEQGFDRVERYENVTSDVVVAAELKPFPSSPVARIETVKLVNGKQCLEGSQLPLAETWQDAFQQFREGWDEFRRDHTGNTLFWRRTPVLRSYCDPMYDEEIRYYVMARVGIGDLP